MIFLSCLIELPIIDTHSPSCDGSLWDQLIFRVFNDYHAFLLRYHLNGANTLTKGNKIDNPDVKEFQDLFLHHFFHHIIKPLGLPRWCNG